MKYGVFYYHNWRYSREKLKCIKKTDGTLVISTTAVLGAKEFTKGTQDRRLFAN
jgi:hypothetical protein